MIPTLAHGVKSTKISKLVENLLTKLLTIINNWTRLNVISRFAIVQQLFHMLLLQSFLQDFVIRNNKLFAQTLEHLLQGFTLVIIIYFLYIILYHTCYGRD